MTNILIQLANILSYIFKTWVDVMFELMPLVNQIKNLPYDIVALSIGVPSFVIIAMFKLVALIKNK